MDFLTPYYTVNEDDRVVVSAEQGSAFAKQVADDFNPIHHPESRRFCVPGDLLFSIAVSRYGLRQNMRFQFLDLLSADVPVEFPAITAGITTGVTTDNAEELEDNLSILNHQGKPTLGITLSGEGDDEAGRKESLVRNYVAFSGHNFPDILVPLMREQNVMFNPKRPLVIYESMQLKFEHFDCRAAEVELGHTELMVAGKRGEAKLHFVLKDQDKQIGEGVKTLILSGLRDFDEQAIAWMRKEYADSKTKYLI